MRKIIVILLLFLIQLNLFVYANYNSVYVADIQYDWINKSYIEKESIISEIHYILFKEPLDKIDNFKKANKDFLKDKNYKNHYLAASAGHKDFDENYLSAFYYKNKSYIYIYAIQNKKDTSKSYYYDALGNLRYIDFIHGEFPDYPYYAYQYKVNGTPVSAIYYVSKDNQYVFNPDGTFKGVWYKHKMYDEHSKVILKRTHY